MKIQYKINAKVKADSVIELFKNSGLNRPIDDLNRIQLMLDNC